MLPTSEFLKLIDIAPLAAIDLIIESDDGVLLGKRENEPAKGYWFVPGGRILKNETLDKAIRRISKKEINIEVTIRDATLLGAFEHFYSNSFADDNISTHYVILAYKIKLNIKKFNLPTIEHSEYDFFSLKDIQENIFIHENTKQYFNNIAII